MSANLRTDERFIRPITEADIDSIMEIEITVYPHPWTPGIFRDCLRVGYYCQLMETAQVVEAYGIMSVAARECHILNLCVRKQVQGKGIGKIMLEHLLGAAKRLHAETAFLEVRPSNKPALALYSAVGFNEVGIRRAYYPDTEGREDALILALDLS